MMWNHRFNDGHPNQDQGHNHFQRADSLKRPYSAPSEGSLRRANKKMKGDEEASGGDAWGGDQTLDYLTPRDFDPSILKERPQNGAEQITKSLVPWWINW